MKNSATPCAAIYKRLLIYRGICAHSQRKTFVNYFDLFKFK